MKKQLLLLVILLGMVGSKTYAHDIEVQNADGVTIYYIWTNNKTELAVSYRGYDFTRYSDEYTGNVVIPESVTYEGKTYSVTSIGYGAFAYCAGLTSITIGNSVTSIGSSAFSGCTCLTSITIPNSVTSIGSNAFSGCNGLTSVNILVTDLAAFCNNKIVSLINSKVGKPIRLLDAEGKEIKEYIIPNSVTSIGDYAFRNCTSLTSVTITNNVTSIGNSAFSGSGLKKTIWLTNTPPSGYSNVGGGVNYVSNNQYSSLSNTIVSSFAACSSLTNITIGNQVKEILFEAFKGCAALPKISIPKSVTYIGDNVFDGCNGLKEVIIEDRDTELKLGNKYDYSPLFSDCPLDYVYIVGNIRYGISPFKRNTTLRKVVITDKETEISDYEFYGCTNLQEFTIGDGVEVFGYWAFSGCSSLQSISFGTQLKTIGMEAFSDCTSVTEITSKAATPPTCNTQALDDINKWNCKLIVPQGSMDAYKAANQWKDFFFISEGEGGGDTPDPDEKKCAMPTISYNNGELSFDSATEGAEFVSSIIDADITSYTTKTIQLGVTYNISVYATKPGFEKSETATATLSWIDVAPKTEGITNDIANVPANAVLIQSDGGMFTIQGVNDGTPINVYSINGTQAGSAISTNGSAVVGTNLQPGSIAIVKIGEKSVKVVVK